LKEGAEVASIECPDWISQRVVASGHSDELAARVLVGLGAADRGTTPVGLGTCHRRREWRSRRAAARTRNRAGWRRDRGPDRAGGVDGRDDPGEWGIKIGWNWKAGSSSPLSPPRTSRRGRRLRLLNQPSA